MVSCSMRLPYGLLFYAPPGWPPVPPVLLSLPSIRPPVLCPSRMASCPSRSPVHFLPLFLLSSFPYPSSILCVVVKFVCAPSFSSGLLFYAPPGWPPVPPVLLSISFLSSSFLLFHIRRLYYVSSSNLFALRASARVSCSMPPPGWPPVDPLPSGLLFYAPPGWPPVPPVLLSIVPRVFLRALRRCVSNRSAAQACFTTYFRKIFCWKIWRIQPECLTLHSLLGNGGSRHRKAAFGAAATDVARPAQK